MKVDALFVIMAIIFLFAAWVATGGPSRPIATAGPWITPVTRSGEESQGYHSLAPSNPINTGSYPKQVGGATGTVSTGNYQYERISSGDSSYASTVYIEHSSIGPYSGNPNQEYVSIVNSSQKSVSFSGWKLKSKTTGTVITIPSAPPVAAGHKLTVVSGNQSENNAFNQGTCISGDNPCVYLNRNLEAYASMGETITLTDSTGKVVDAFSY